MSQAQERVLWNIYGNRYDLTNFLDKHPGGRKILELSRSDKDLTPLFESYQLSIYPQTNLSARKNKYIYA